MPERYMGFDAVDFGRVDWPKFCIINIKSCVMLVFFDITNGVEQSES